MVRVYFSCRCGRVYETRQMFESAQNRGQFSCAECGETVHAWSGAHNFRGWRAVVV
jgi:predicted SprT family Zn-dependent metalloprotease